MDIIPHKTYNQIIFGNFYNNECNFCNSENYRISYKKVLLEEVNLWRKTCPNSLCDIVELQIIFYYKKHDEYTNLMSRTATSHILWLTSMINNSAILGYSF
jgi:hypothetical protein